MNTGALNEGKLLENDKRMEKRALPSDVGRLDRKISKSYKCMNDFGENNNDDIDLS